MTVKTRQGFQRLEWQRTRDRNEALDCRVYARAAAWLMGMDRWNEDRWETLAAQLLPGRTETPSLPAGQPQRPRDTPPPPRSSGWMGDRRKGNWF